ncbi:hypothetical protein FQA47_007102 [Oryzias melastigma]|uniref:Uncharacterized protein n=1 Tax=Oryzias melastigma TaxID=30732 RepID=A0A834EZN4_ORYME|nr:hypothetical protein FQA47_007102 [Oryzias melastigma]
MRGCMTVLYDFNELTVVRSSVNRVVHVVGPCPALGCPLEASAGKKLPNKGGPAPPQMWSLPPLNLLFTKGEDAALSERLWLGLEG